MSLSFVHPLYLYLLVLIPVAAGIALVGRRKPTRTRFWVGLGLRTVGMLLLILALAGAQLRSNVDTLTVVFVLDVSDSVPAEDQARGEAIIRESIQEMPTGDRAAIVVFGEDALVERLAAESRALADLASVPVTARTDVASALQLAMALLPDEGAKRLVLLTDGRENVGQAMAQAELAAAHGIELSFVPLGGQEGAAEVLVESLEAPPDVRKGQTFDLRVAVRSTTQGAATLRIVLDGRVIHSQEVRLRAGVNRYTVPVDATETGFRRLRAQIVPEQDTRLQNNEASAYTVVLGPPQVLVVEGVAGEADNLVEALGEAEMEVTEIAPDQMPTSLDALAAFDGIALVNVGAYALPPESHLVLQAYVRDLGRGLLMTGGENAYGAGGYLRTPIEETLPVDMDVRTREQSPNLALMLVVDKSGSMGRCHCDNPDLNQTYVRREVGQPKVDIAKEAVMRAAGALGPQDYLGVVAFDDAARWALEVDRVVDVVQLERSIGTIQAQGQTNMQAGVEAAYDALQDVEARYKHIILMTDGWVRTGDLSNLAASMYDQGLTLSVVAAGGGSAEYLSDLAEKGGGRYYPAVDILRVPDFFLKETVRAVGKYIVEEPFYPLPSVPSSILRGLDPTRLPALLGYNGTTAKSTARVILTTPRGDPLLATWQYGLGRSAAWTSDVTGRWGAEWVGWDGFGRFGAQLVAWTLPAPRVEGLTASASVQNDQVVIEAEILDDAGRPRSFLDGTAVVIGPDLERTEADLWQVGAGAYRAALDLVEPGSYLVQLDVRDGETSIAQRTLGVVVPYSPEYKESGTDWAALQGWAGVTDGGELQSPVAAFVHDLPFAKRAQGIWRALLMVTVCLFPLDVAVRRLVLSPSDVTKAAGWIRERISPRREGTRRQEPVLGELFQARERVRRRRTRTEAPIEVRNVPAPEDGRSAADREAKAPEIPEEDQAQGDQEDTLARLREAKRRAHRDR